MNTTAQNPYINMDYFEDLTGDLTHVSENDMASIGERIRHLREQKGMTLEAVSRITGFDAELLNKIEAGELQPQLGTIIKLSKALDSAFSFLVSGPGTKPYTITRKNDRIPISRSASGKGKKPLYSYKSLAHEVRGRHMEALVVLLEEEVDEEASVHQGEEFIFVLDGAVLLKIGDDQFELEPGDSVYYLSTVPHLISAKKEKAAILAVIYEGEKDGSNS
jgi:transcriptional regulator with XRE-family HTH domain